MGKYIHNIKKYIPETLEVTIPGFKSFWISFIAIFIIVILQHVGIRASSLVSRLPKKIDAFIHELPKIESKTNTNQLKKKYATWYN